LSVDSVLIHMRGIPVRVPSAQIQGRTVISTGKWLKTAVLRDEELIEGEAVPDPGSFISQLKQKGLAADIFTFAQRLPDKEPKYPFHVEWENFAIIPITTYSEWSENRVDTNVRRAVKKATKSGIVVKEVPFNDTFVNGIVGINNETPVRQGRKFWHYQKSFEDVKRENSTYADRTLFIGAYFRDELIGYMRITTSGRVANVVQLLSMMKHYDKRPANALIAKAVQVCEQKGLQYLLYYNYIRNDPKSSLTEFKRRNGFEPVLLPRYYVPLSAKGKIVIALGLHRGLVKRIPQPVLTKLLKIRADWNARKVKQSEGAAQD